MALPTEERERLMRTKLLGLLGGLVGSHAGSGVDRSAVESRGNLTALVVDGRAHVLTEVGDASSVASSVLWATRRGCSEVSLMVDSGADDAARFAGYFSPTVVDVEVLVVEGPTAVPVEPSPVPRLPPPPEVPSELLSILESEGLEIVIEHGVVRGEVLGLEVARLVRWSPGSGGDGELHLEAGVGRFDRDAVAAVDPDGDPADALARTVEMVRRYRFDGAPPHPMQFLCRERWLRSSIISNPATVGADDLVAIAMATEAAGLRDSHPAAALGTCADGSAILVVCSTGIDLALVPLAAELRSVAAGQARLVLAVPDQDRFGATVELAAMLEPPAEVVGVPVGWG